MDDEWDEIEFEGPQSVSRRFMPVDIIVLFLGLITGVLSAITNTFSMAQMLVASHANHKVDQHDFHEQAAQEIETLTGDENG